MSGRQSESDQVAGRHDRRDDAAWFHYQPNAAAPTPPPGAEADTFVRQTMTLTQTRPRSIPPVEVGIDAVHDNPWASSPPPYDSVRAQSMSPSSNTIARPRGLPSVSNSRSSSRAYTSTDRTRGPVDERFTSSATGIGASILGAVVGGFVASRASEALQSSRAHKGGAHRFDTDGSSSNVPRIASTILGAVAGGLGANVLANHLEDQHDRSRGRPTWDRQRNVDTGNMRDTVDTKDTGETRDTRDLWGTKDTKGQSDDRRTSWGREHERDEEEYDFLHDAAEKHER